MTENEKIELFDKWYAENYDEWAEGEEGIALREELEQAFKGGIAELEAQIEKMKSCNNCKYHQNETYDCREFCEFEDICEKHNHWEFKEIKEK